MWYTVQHWTVLIIFTLILATQQQTNNGTSLILAAYLSVFIGKFLVQYSLQPTGSQIVTVGHMLPGGVYRTRDSWIRKNETASQKTI